MNTTRTMAKQFGVCVFQNGIIHELAGLDELFRVRLREIIPRRCPTNLDAVESGNWCIVKFRLRIDNVSDAVAGFQFLEIFFNEYPTTNGKVLVYESAIRNAHVL